MTSFIQQKKKPLMLAMMQQHVLIAWLKIVRTYLVNSKELAFNTSNYMHKLTSNSNTTSRVSINYNKYTPDHPWYGSDQGAGNATIWWAVLSHSLLMAYRPQAHLWNLTNLTQSINPSQGIDAFCNDTALTDTSTIDNPWTTREMINTTQTNVEWVTRAAEVH